MDMLSEKSATSSPFEKVPPYSWVVLGILGVVNSINYMDRWVMSVLIEPIKHDLGLSDTQMGLLTGLSFSIGYAIFAMPIARIADNGNRRNVLVWSISFWSLMTGLAGFAQQFWQLFLARLGIGIGESGCIPSGQSMIADYFPRDRRPFAQSVFSAGSMLGKILGIGGAGFLVAWAGWQGTLMIMAIPGFIMALVVRFAIREPKPGQFDPPCPQEPIAAWPAFRSLIAIPSYTLMIGALATSNLVIFGVQNWSPAFYMRIHGLSAMEVGAAIATVVGVGSAVGLLTGGYAMQRLMRRDPCWAARVAVICHLLAGACSVASFLVASPHVSLLLFAATSIIASLSSGGVISIKLDIVDPRCRALAAALSMTVISVIGLGLGPLVVGALSDFFAASEGSEGLRIALAVTAAFNVVPAAFYFAASRTLRADLAAREAAQLKAV